MVTVVVRPQHRIEAIIREERINASVREVTVKLAGVAYTGPYNVVPSEEEHVLSTSGKTMDRDVVVRSVPMALATTAQIDKLFRR